MSHPLRRAVSLCIIFSVILSLGESGTISFGAQQQQAAAGQGTQTATIEGRVFGSDRTTPLPGAVVRAVRGEGAQVFSSLPSDEKGNYSISNLPPGSYDVVVEMPDGVFVVERTLSISEAKVYSLSLATVPAESVAKQVSAVDKPVLGYAWTMEGQGPKAVGFWRTPGGIAIIGVGVVGLLALAMSGGDGSNNGSSSTP